ncbi:MATE family efflux transporter [Pseudomonas syringae]|uniref:MATE family efflux transporter n=1 Tax=Pseudomonas syringae TaxID=317 RepID=UPI0004656C4C|nr:MATE family efflux transporter [Pseudomonas syringae]
MDWLMARKKNKFSTGRMANVSMEAKGLLILGFPIAATMIAQTLMSLTDLMLVSRLGEKQVAGVSLGIAVYSFGMLFGLGVITAVTPMIAKAYGRKDFNAVSNYTRQGLWVAALVAMPGVIALILTRSILLFLNVEAETANIASDYCVGALMGLPAFLIYVNLRCFLSAIGRPKTTTWIMFLAVPVNYIIGHVLIFGVMDAEGLGITGAGLASSVTRLAILATVIATLKYGADFKCFSLFENVMNVKPVVVKKIVLLGLPVGLRILLAEGMLPIIALLISTLGTIDLVAHMVAVRLSGVSAVIALGFSSAASTRVAWQVAANNQNGVRVTGYVASALAFGVSALLAMLLIFFPTELVMLLFDIDDAEVLALTSHLLKVVAAYQILNAIQTAVVGSLLGVSDTKIPTCLVLIGNWLVGLASAYGLVVLFEATVTAVWGGLVLGQVFVVVTCLCRFHMKTKALHE